jgi:cellulose synthase operon protein C
MVSKDFSTSARSPLGIRLYRVVSLAILLSLAFSLAGCKGDPKTQAEKSIRRGNDYMAKGDIKAADVEFRKAVQLQPKMPEALFAYGTVQARMRNYPEAYTSFVTALKYRAEYPEAQIAIADLMVKTGQFDDAREKAEAVLQKYPNQKVGELIIAESMLAKGDIDGAQKIIDAYRLKDADDPRATFDSAAIDMRLGHWETSQPKLLHVWQKDPSDISPIVAVVTKLQQDGQTDRAEKFLNDLNAATPNNQDVELLTATFYFKNKRINETEQILQHVQKNAKDSIGQGALAFFYLSTGQKDRAEQQLKSIIEANPKDQINAARYAEILLADGKHAEARAVVEKALKANGSDPLLLTMLGTMQIDDQQFDSAAASLKAAINIDRYSPNALIQLARLQMMQGNAEQAKASISDALQRSPSNLLALTFIANLDLRDGRINDATGHLSNALSIQPDFAPAQILMAQAQAKKGNFAYASDNLPKLISKVNDSQTLDQLGQSLAEVYVAQKQPAKLKSAADAIFAKDPKSQAGLMLTGLSYATQGNVDGGVAAMRKYVDANPWSNGYNIVAGFAFANQKFAAAKDAYQRSIQLDPSNKPAQYGLADSYSASGDPKSAKGIYQNLAQSDSSNTYPLIRLAQIAANSGDSTGAKNYYQQALAIEPKNFIANNNLAWILIAENQKPDLALRYAEAAREASPNDPRVADTLGVIYTNKGAYDAAIQQLRDCVGRAPQNPEYKYHLATAYYKAGRFSNAKPELEAALKEPSFKHADEAKKMLLDVQAH